MLDSSLKQQLSQYLELLEGEIILTASKGEDKTSQDMMALLNEISEMSDKISIKEAVLKRTPSFTVARPEEEARVTLQVYR